MKETDYFITLIHKQLSGELSEENKAVLDEWLNERGENRQLCEEIRLTWELAGRDPAWASLPLTDQEVEEELAHFHQRVEKEKEIGPASFTGSFWFKVSAVLLLMALSVGTVFFWRGLQSVPEAPLRLSLEEGRLEALLPDSTVVVTNQHSTLSILDFDEKRAVQLVGEAYFDVRADRNRPFYIELEQARVKVVGTSFVIRAYPDRPHQLNVLEGEVEVQLEDQLFTLLEGEQLRWKTKGKAEKSSSPERNLLAWKTRALVFAQTPLSELLPVLESYYGIRFKVTEPELLDCRFTGTFKDIPLQELMEILSYSLELQIVRQGKNYFSISGKGCGGGGQ